MAVVTELERLVRVRVALLVLRVGLAMVVGGAVVSLLLLEVVSEKSLDMTSNTSE